MKKYLCVKYFSATKKYEEKELKTTEERNRYKKRNKDQDSVIRGFEGPKVAVQLHDTRNSLITFLRRNSPVWTWGSLK